MLPADDAKAAIELPTADFLVMLARSLHEVGQPSHLLEDTLQRVAVRLGQSIEVMALPTVVLMADAAGRVRHMVSGPIGATDLERLSQCTAVAEEVARGALTPADASERLATILRAPPRWGQAATAAAYVLSAAAFAVFFRGDAADLLVACAVGLVVGLVAVFLRRARGTRLFELTAAAAAGLVVGVGEWELGDPTAWVPLASGLIILLPGLSLVDAVEELANGRLTSGSARLAGVIVGFLALIFGVLLGLRLGELLPPAPPAVGPQLPGWAVVPALLAVAAGSTIRFRARPADTAVVLAASALALFGSRLGAAALGPLTGPFLAALLVSLAGKGYARVARRPAEVVVVPGLAVLVPGSVGLRSAAALLRANPAAGVETGFHMFVIAMALVAGLLAGNMLVRGRAPA
jgi:uncharacterized membrane protein YjjP (DUF1212 family)